MNSREEQENVSDVLEELIENHNYLKECEQKRVGFRSIGRKHVCPRCRSITRLQTEDPYCNYCNWDSLDDQTNYQFS